MMEPIPKNLPPAIRQLFEAKQFIELQYPGDFEVGDPNAPTSDQLAAEISEILPNPDGIVWIWNDCAATIADRVYGVAGKDAVERLRSGEAVTFVESAELGVKSFVFPTSDPATYVDARPFRRRDVVLDFPVDQLAERYISINAPDFPSPDAGLEGASLRQGCDGSHPSLE